MTKQSFLRQSRPQHQPRITDWVWENGTSWDEPPRVGGGLEEGGSGMHTDPLPQLFGRRRRAFQGAAFAPR